MCSSVLVLLLLSGCHEGAAERQVAEAKVYASPGAVFDAYRQTCHDRDWRSHYFLYTRKGQEYLLFGAVFMCGASGGERGAVLKEVEEKLGPSDVEVAKCYYESYKRKHGHGALIDKALTALNAYSASRTRRERGDESERPELSLPPEEEVALKALPVDDELVRRAIYDATNDKVGFFAAVSEIVEAGRKPDVVGELKELVVDGDRATAHVKTTKLPIPGDSTQEATTYDQSFEFRRVNGGWLMDSP